MNKSKQMNLVNRCLVTVTMTIFILSMLHQGNAREAIKGENGLKIAKVLSDFNQLLFFEMDTAKALKKHFFTGSVCSVDRKYGLENEFLEVTSDVPPAKRLRYFALEFEQSFGLSLFRWQMRCEKLNEKSEIDAEAIAGSEEFRRFWEQFLQSQGLTEESIDEKGNLDADNLEFYENFIGLMNQSLAKTSDQKLLLNNLKFIMDNTKIKHEVFEGNEYFIADDKIFSYTIAIKDGVPKIMRINRNYSSK